MATRKPILNGILQSDLAGAGYAGTDFGGLEIGYVTKAEVWFGIRTGGKAGSGSKDDPFDGGTAAKIATKIDWANANYDMPLFMFREGEYLYSSFHYLSRFLKPGSKVIGMGGRNGSTVLTLDPAIATSIAGNIFGVTGSGVNGEGHVIEGITFDMNWPALEAAGAPAHCAVGGIGLLGDNNSVHDCVVKNHYGSNTGGNECFAIILDAVPASSNRSSRITDSRVESPYGDYHSGIVIAAPTGEINAAINGKIDHCEVLGYRDDTAFAGGNFHAFGLDGGTIQNCYTSGAVIAFYAEQGKKIIVTNNQFMDSWRFGVLLLPGASGITDVKLLNNFIEVRDDEIDSADNPYAIMLGGSSVVEVRNNTLKLRVTGNATSGFPFRSIISGSTDLGLGHRLTGNTVDEAFNLAAFPADAIVRENVHPDGTPVDNLSDSVALTRSDNENGALWGSMLFQTTFTDIDGYTQYYLDASSYKLVLGDILTLEVFCSESNAAFDPSVRLEFDDATTSDDLVDQHGLFMAHSYLVHPPGDLSDYAKGRWYRRTASLDDYVDQTVDRLGIGDYATDTGTNNYYFRNVRIIDASGTIARSFFTADFPAEPLLSSVPFHVSAYSFSLVQAKTAVCTIPYSTVPRPRGDCELNIIEALTGAAAIQVPFETFLATGGQKLVISLTQDGTGGHAVTWASIYAFGTDYTAAMVPTTANAKCEVEFRYNSTADKWRCVGIARGF